MKAGFLKFLKTFILIVVVFYSILFLFQTHFILGSGYHFLKLPVLLLLIVSFIFIGPKTYIRYWILVLALAIVVEISFKELNKYRLQKADFNREVKLLSYNVLFNNSYQDDVVAIIKESDPDILLLQEVTPAWSKFLRQKLDSQFPYKSEFPIKFVHGSAVYSKYPIKKSYTESSYHSVPFAQVIEMDIEGSKFQIFNTHLASPAVAIENPDNFLNLLISNYKQRTEQLHEINKIALDKSQNYDIQLVVGDLNTMPFEPLFKQQEEFWLDVFNQSGEGIGWTFPNTKDLKPFVTLDYMLLRGSANAKSAKVISGGSSDHLPIEGVITF